MELLKSPRTVSKKKGIFLAGLFKSNFWTILLHIYIGPLTISCSFTPIVLSKTMNMISKVGNIDHIHNVNLFRLIKLLLCYSHSST